MPGWTSADIAKVKALARKKQPRVGSLGPYQIALPVREGGYTSADIAAMMRAGGNPYGTLGPSPGRVSTVDRSRRGGGAKAKQMTEWDYINQYAEMLRSQQKSALDQIMADRDRRSQAQMASMAGFGAALQGYSHDLWGQTAGAYQNAAAAQQSMAQGLGGQVGSGIAGARAQQAALAGSLGQGEGGFGDMPTAEAGAAQVASEGGKDTGGMMGAVGTAWGGYGATRPEYIGFMTGQNQMQLAREDMEGDRELEAEFLKLGLGNTKEAFEMYQGMQENKRQNLSASLAQQTLRQNLAIQSAKIQQDYAEMRARAKTAAEKARVDKWYKQQQISLQQQGIAIDQQNANTAVTRAETGRINANKPPSPGSAPKYSQGNYQQKISSAMYNVANLFEQSGGKDRAGYAFNILWPQIAPFVTPANKKQARDLLLARIRKAAKSYSPKPPSSGGSGLGSGNGGPR